MCNMKKDKSYDKRTTQRKRQNIRKDKTQEKTTHRKRTKPDLGKHKKIRGKMTTVPQFRAVHNEWNIECKVNNEYEDEIIFLLNLLGATEALALYVTMCHYW